MCQKFFLVRKFEFYPIKRGKKYNFHQVKNGYILLLQNLEALLQVLLLEGRFVSNCGFINFCYLMVNLQNFRPQQVSVISETKHGLRWSEIH